MKLIMTLIVFQCGAIIISHAASESGGHRKYPGRSRGATTLKRILCTSGHRWQRDETFILHYLIFSNPALEVRFRVKAKAVVQQSASVKSRDDRMIRFASRSVPSPHWALPTATPVRSLRLDSRRIASCGEIVGSRALVRSGRVRRAFQNINTISLSCIVFGIVG